MMDSDGQDDPVRRAIVRRPPPKAIVTMNSTASVHSRKHGQTNRMIDVHPQQSRSDGRPLTPDKIRNYQETQVDAKFDVFEDW
jgi:hypothetical protein